MQLRKALSKFGLRYRLHVTGLPGRPDVVLPRSRIVVFCDGDFWHGRNWKASRLRLKVGANSKYWISKIGYNIARDKRQTRELERAGWLVIRLWETDILKDPLPIAKRVWRFVQRRSA